MQFVLLGPLEIRDASGQRIELRGEKRRGVLALLLVQRGRPLSVGHILEALWEGGNSKSAAGTVQSYVSHLRRTFADDPHVLLARRSGGYALDVAAELFDIAQFEALVRAAADARDEHTRIKALDSALILWRRTPLEEFAQQWATVERERLERLRFAAQLDRIDARLSIGQDRRAITDLEALVTDHPLDEGVWARLLVTYHRCGRRGDALRACRDVRKLLVEQFGLQPGRELAELERRILSHDEHLHWPLEPSMSDTPAPASAVSRPQGLVTFMLTDVEGSTSLWDTRPEEMRVALRRHELLMARTVAEHRGVLIKERGEGDSTLSVFEKATDAVAAAVAIQRAIAADRHVDTLVLPTRIGLHTGEAELRDADYYGGTLNRAARIRTLASGGQIVCSRATGDLVSDRLAGDVAINELGAHRIPRAAAGGGRLRSAMGAECRCDK